MNSLARLSSLVAALCIGVPMTGFSHDHDHGGHSGGGWHGGDYHGGGNWHGGHDYHGYHGHYYYGGSHAHFYGSYFPFFGYAPYYAAPYYDAGYYDSYYDSPSYGLSISSSVPYHGRVDDHGDNLAIDVQRALRRDGYYHGGIDGDVGAGTRGAIRQYQYDHSLEVTGRIDRSLIRSLGLD